MKISIWTILILAALIAISLWAYWGVTGNPFHFDDALFLQSPQVNLPGNPWYLLRPTQTRQLTYLTFYWNYRIWGDRPAGYHLFNLVLHCLNAIGVYFFVFLLCRREPAPGQAGLSRWIPAAAAGIFALHPIQSEAVNYVYQRSVLLAGFFSLAGLVVFLRRESALRPRWLDAATVVFIVLACAGKETAITIPLVMGTFAWIYYPDSGEPSSPLHRLRRFLLLPAAAIFAGAFWVLYTLFKKGEQTLGLPLAKESLQYLASQIQVFFAYLRLLIWPANLTIDHGFNPAPPISGYALACWLLLIGLVIVLLRIRRANPGISFLGLTFFLLLAPSSSIVPSADLMFEHRLYLPMIAGAPLLALLLMQGCRILFRGPGAAEKTWAALLSVALFACALVDRQRTSIWGDNVRLWSDAAAKVPGNPRAHFNLAVACLEPDRVRAYRELQEAVRLRPDYAEALYNLGWLEQAAGQLDAAREHFREAIQADDSNWQSHLNLANVEMRRGNPGGAIQAFEVVIRFRPDQWPVYESLAAAQIQNGDSAGALATLQSLLSQQPARLRARYLRAYALLREKRISEGEAEIRFVTAHDGKGELSTEIFELRSYLDALSGTGKGKAQKH